ncbi:MAG: ABC transporter substrate-binding protein [Alphaproteobacteria bacterium]|nr:ABC transporter substrate-binding protein [Alphaproteobacteria bacterium]
MTSTDIESKFAKLDDILHNDIDIDYAARYVVGKYWNRMSESQRKDYLDLFQKYTESLYKSYPLTIDKGEVSFTVDNIIADTKLVNVHCTVYVKKLGHDTQNASNGGFKIIFIIVKDDAGKIKVRDIKVSESSFLISYRDRFYKMIHDDNDDDIDWFLDDLYMRIEDNNERNAKNLDEQEF